LKKLQSGRFQPADGWTSERAVRNCELVIQAGFRAKSLPLACVLVELLADNAPDTVRGTMYAAVSNGYLPDTTKKSYRNCQRLLKELRLRDVIPFDWITDNVRGTSKSSSWSGLADFADTVRDAYRKDFWASLTEYVCVIVEKDTAAGRLEPATRKFDVALHPLRGFDSLSYGYEIANGWSRIDKPITAYYVGDHDPSGRDIERNVREFLTRRSGKEPVWRRLAVEPKHFDEFNIIPLAPKKKDSRYPRFAEKYGDRCAEVEAIPVNDLRRMVEKAILVHVDQAKWQRLQLIEDQEQKTWQKMIDRLKRKGAA
jgi:hypothetical protein